MSKKELIELIETNVPDDGDIVVSDGVKVYPEFDVFKEPTTKKGRHLADQGRQTVYVIARQSPSGRVQGGTK